MGYDNLFGICQDVVIANLEELQNLFEHSSSTFSKLLSMKEMFSFFAFNSKNLVIISSLHSKSNGQSSY